jgi:hypothetical protein
MYLFTRRARLTGAAGVEWAAAITAKVNEVAGTDVQLWTNVFSPGLGTATWTSWHADLASLEAMTGKLEADPGFQTLAAQGADHAVGGFDDGLMQTIYGEPDPARTITYVGGVQAVCASGNIARAMTAGVEIAQKGEAATGLSTMFVRSLTGPYGGVGWLTGYEDIAVLEAASDALAASSDWLTYLDGIGGVFVEDAAITQQTLYRRVV